jgi:hypothetical protein
MTKDLEIYKKITFKGSLGIFICLLILSCMANNFLMWGMLLGSSLANLNIFILSISMYELLIKQSGPLALSFPVLFFLFVTIIALVLAFYLPGLLLGFACGLTSPIILGVLIAYRAARPA